MRNFFHALLLVAGVALAPACNQNGNNSSGPSWPSPSLTPSNISGGMVTLTWSAAIDNSGTGITYAVYQGTTGSGSEDMNNPVAGTPTSLLTVTVSGLTANDPYTFIVVATDGNGNSLNGAEATITAK
jgi:chitin-binding protein